MNISECRWRAVLYGFSALLVLGVYLLKMWQWREWDLGSWDAGAYLQALWQIAHGRLLAYDTFLQRPVLADAAQYILYPLALLVRLAGVRGAFFAEAAGFGLLLLPLGLLAERRLGHPAGGVLFFLLALLNPAVFGNITYDWHPDVFGAAAVAWLLWADETERKDLYYAALVLALASKNQAAALVLAYALLSLIRGRRGVRTLVSIAAALLYLLLDNRLPAFFGAVNNNLLVNYGYLGRGLGAIVLNILLHPLYVLHRSWRFRGYWESLLLPLGGLSLLSPLEALPGLLVGTLNVLGQNPLLVFPYSQYSLWLMPFLVPAAAGGLRNLATVVRRRSETIAAGAAATAILAGGFFVLRAWPTEFWRVKARPAAAAALWQAARLIPAGAPVYGETGTTAEISLRREVASTPYDDPGLFLRTLRGSRRHLYLFLAPGAAFVHIDPAAGERLKKEFFALGAFQVIYSRGGVELYRSEATAGELAARYRVGG